MTLNKSKEVLISSIFIIFSYEWFVSGIDKVLTGKFVIGLPQLMASSIPSIHFKLYAYFLQRFCLPHSTLFAWVIEITEILVGFSFAFLAIQTLSGHFTKTVMWLGIIAGLVSAFMNLNFLLFQGEYIFVNTTNPFNTGLPIDFIMFLIQLAIAISYYLMLRSKNAKN